MRVSCPRIFINIERSRENDDRKLLMKFEIIFEVKRIISFAQPWIDAKIKEVI